MPHFLIRLLLTIFIRSISSLSLPAPSNPTTNITLLPSNALATCHPFALFHLRPLYRDCTRAMTAFSSSRLPGYFHSGGMIDEWQLPVTERAGTCEVSVQLAPFSLPEAGSWEEIKGVVSRLGEECRRRGALGDVTGGEIRVGVHERILVEMVRS